MTGRDQGRPEKRKGSTTRKKRSDGDGGVICVRYVAFLSRMMDDAKHNTVRCFFYFFSNLAEMFTIIPVFMHEVVFKKKLLKSHDATAKCTKYMMQGSKQ